MELCNADTADTLRVAEFTRVSIARHGTQAPEAIFTPSGQLATTADKLHLMLKGLAELPAGAVQLKPVRVALYKSYVASIDEGWTRFLLEQYGFPVKNIVNKDVKAGNLNTAWDVIILPDSAREVILEGRSSLDGVRPK